VGEGVFVAEGKKRIGKGGIAWDYGRAAKGGNLVECCGVGASLYWSWGSQNKKKLFSSSEIRWEAITQHSGDFGNSFL